MSPARDARVSLHFKLPYWTQWGQSLVVLLSQGSDGTKKHALNCTHQGEELIWEGETQVSASVRGLEYSYAIIDEADEIEAEEVSRRTLALPDGLADGSVIELRDSWQVENCGWFLLTYSAPSLTVPSMALKQGEKDKCIAQDTSHPGYLLSSGAFRGNILGPPEDSPSPAVARQRPQPDEIVVIFRLWYITLTAQLDVKKHCLVHCSAVQLARIHHATVHS